MAEIHHQLGRRHLTAAKMHRAHAERLRKWLGSARETIPSAFMAAVADTCGADSAILSLFGEHQPEALIAASDATAAAAHDLECALGEGPAREAVDGRELVAARDEVLGRRWPLYGPAVAGLGVREAAAVPLGMPDHCLGTLTVFGLRRGGGTGHSGVAALGTVADALTHTVLLADDAGIDGEATGVMARDGVIRLPLPDDADRQAVVHQAVGMVAGECSCGIADALALIQAHAFAESEPVEAVAARVVSRKLRLGTDG